MQRDPIEETEAYKSAMKCIQPRLDDYNETLTLRGMQRGRCHLFWKRKKELLKSYKIDWKTPDEMNPDVHFD